MTAVSRRTVLGVLGAGAVWSVFAAGGPGALGGVAPAGAAPARTRSAPFDLATATADTFRPHVGSRFRLSAAGAKPADATLVQVSASPPDGRTDAFSLLFRSATVALGQATYGVEHATLGSFSLLLVPAGARDVAGVVNHLLA